MESLNSSQSPEDQPLTEKAESVIEDSQAQVRASQIDEETLVKQRINDRRLDAKADLFAALDPEIIELKRRKAIEEAKQNALIKQLAFSEEMEEKKQAEELTLGQPPYGLTMPHKRSVNSLMRELKHLREEDDARKPIQQAREDYILRETSAAREQTFKMAEEAADLLKKNNVSEEAKLYSRHKVFERKLFAKVEKIKHQEEHIGWWINPADHTLNPGTKMLLTSDGQLVGVRGRTESADEGNSVICDPINLKMSTDNFEDDLTTRIVPRDNPVGRAQVVFNHEAAIQDALAMLLLENGVDPTLIEGEVALEK